MNNALSKWIISASGWRTIFAKSGDEQDKTTDISNENANLVAAASKAFCDYIKDRNGSACQIILGKDTRPTGSVICEIFYDIMKKNGLTVYYIGTTAAPEIMAFSRKFDAFVYVSASHNPIGHNGIKFGLNDGGVLPGSECDIIKEKFLNIIKSNSIPKISDDICLSIDKTKKQEAISSYFDFTKEVIADSSDFSVQESFFDTLKEKIATKPLTILADMNGSARCLSIDKNFLQYCGLGFEAINDKVGNIVHEIIPEPENMIYVADFMTKLQSQGKTDALLGYMPDCDGDRGNIVFWNEKTKRAEILKAQEVFALCVLSELASVRYAEKIAGIKPQKLAVAVNDPTSMRIDEIAAKFNAEVFRAEVGEANVVNLARKLRHKGYVVRILGEGSNGGNITHPAAVRDPINTLFSLVKLLVMPELFELWCEVSGLPIQKNISLSEIQETMPVFTTTGVTDSRALLEIHTKDHTALKAAYQSVLDLQWQNVGASFATIYGIVSFEAVSNNGTEEIRNLKDFTKSAKGGLKLLLKDTGGNNVAFVWMRGSGTEPVFRVMCDVKGDNPKLEAFLLEWHTKMIQDADAFA